MQDPLAVQPILAHLARPCRPRPRRGAFSEEHRRCDELDGGGEDGRLGMACECGAQMAHSVGGKGIEENLR